MPEREHIESERSTRATKVEPGDRNSRQDREKAERDGKQEREEADAKSNKKKSAADAKGSARDHVQDSTAVEDKPAQRPKKAAADGGDVAAGRHADTASIKSSRSKKSSK